MKENFKLFLPIEWWSKILGTLDKKIASMSAGSGYGSVKMEVVIRDGKIKDTIFTDEIRWREKIDS